MDDDLQGREHIARGDAVYADAGFSPLDTQRSGEMPDRGLGRVVRSVVETGQLSPFLLPLPALRRDPAGGEC